MVGFHPYGGIVPSGPISSPANAEQLNLLILPTNSGR
jgi:hypothetical protein